MKAVFVVIVGTVGAVAVNAIQESGIEYFPITQAIVMATSVVTFLLGMSEGYGIRSLGVSQASSNASSTDVKSTTTLDGATITRSVTVHGTDDPAEREKWMAWADGVVERLDRKHDQLRASRN